MGDSHAEVYLHFAWSTKHREESIPSNLERELHRVIQSESLKLRCVVLATGGMLDHIHLLVRFSRTITIAQFMDQIKGVSSTFLNSHGFIRMPEGGELPFRWQTGYGAFSVGPNQLERVTAYVLNQKIHHAEGSIHARWEPPTDLTRPP